MGTWSESQKMEAIYSPIKENTVTNHNKYGLSLLDVYAGSCISSKAGEYRGYDFN